MYSPKCIGVLLAVGLPLIASMAMANTQKAERIAMGVWGGQHINMDVGERTATIEYDCAHGEIEGPLVVDSEGEFQLRGTFTRERGGPVRADDVLQPEPATYSGTIKGNRMTLKLKLLDEDESETFTLEKGKSGELFKCK